MRWIWIDKFTEFTSRQSATAVKAVSLAEEHLHDLYPAFPVVPPVLPGVMMLEAATQAAGWLLHRRSGFARSMAVLKEARNVKYGTFVAPGHALRVEVELARPLKTGGVFKVGGAVDGATALAARIEIAYFSLADRQPELAEMDRRLIEHHRQRWNLIAPAAGVDL